MKIDYADLVKVIVRGPTKEITLFDVHDWSWMDNAFVGATVLDAINQVKKPERRKSRREPTVVVALDK